MDYASQIHLRDQIFLLKSIFVIAYYPRCHGCKGFMPGRSHLLFFPSAD